LQRRGEEGMMETRGSGNKREKRCLRLGDARSDSFAKARCKQRCSVVNPAHRDVLKPCHSQRTRPDRINAELTVGKPHFINRTRNRRSWLRTAFPGVPGFPAMPPGISCIGTDTGICTCCPGPPAPLGIKRWFGSKAARKKLWHRTVEAPAVMSVKA